MKCTEDLPKKSKFVTMYKLQKQNIKMKLLWFISR